MRFNVLVKNTSLLSRRHQLIKRKLYLLRYQIATAATNATNHCKRLKSLCEALHRYSDSVIDWLIGLMIDELGLKS